MSRLLRARHAQHEWRFLDPLPRFFWQVVLGVFLLVAGYCLVPFVLPYTRAAEQIMRTLATGSGVVGIALGLWTAQGVFRRGRNVLTFHLCDEHAPAFRALTNKCQLSKALLVLVLIPSLLWMPISFFAAFMGDGPAGPVKRLFLAGTAPVLVVICLLLHLRNRRKLRDYLQVHACFKTNRFAGGEIELQLVCRNPGFAEAVRAHLGENQGPQSDEMQKKLD